jgi:hypothetical protein
MPNLLFFLKKIASLLSVNISFICLAVISMWSFSSLQQQYHMLAQQSQALSDSLQPMQPLLLDHYALTKEVQQYLLTLQHPLDRVLNQGQVLQRLALGLQQEFDHMKRFQQQQEGGNLPFTIQSLDIWNGKPYLHVISKENLALSQDLTLGDFIEDWKVLEIDCGRLRVVFEDAKHQKQTVHLQRMNHSELAG